jgi:hypothetical protein
MSLIRRARSRDHRGVLRALLTALLLAPAGQALAADPPSAEERLEARRKVLEERLEAARARRDRLASERDAARVKANTYALPQYRLEAEEKQKQIDVVEQEIAAIEKQLAELQQ